MRDQRDSGEAQPGATPMPGALDVAAIPPPDPDSVTQLLGEVEKGQPGAWNRIYALLYRDLHQIARSQIRQQRRGHVTARVHRRNRLRTDVLRGLQAAGDVHGGIHVKTFQGATGLNARSLSFGRPFNVGWQHDKRD